MATKKVVQELITKWKYKVDASEIKRTAAAIKNLKKNFSDVRKSSTAFGKGEFTRIRRIREGWRGLNREVTSYRRNLARPAKGGLGGGMFGGGRGTGRAGLGQSGAFLAGRMMGSTALTSALLGGPALATGFGMFKAVQAAGERQKQEVAFGGLLGGGKEGADSANVMMERLNKFAVETPFQIDALRDLARQSLGGGIDFEKVIPQLGMLGDVTSGNIAHLKRMLANMIEIKNTGRANLRDVRQFGRVGIPIYEALAKATGKSTAQISEMITKGKIGFTEVTKALKLLTSEGGRFFQAMKLQMGTLIGQVSNLGDAFIVIAEKVGKPFLKPLTKVVEWFKDFLVVITPKLENFATGVGTVMETFIWFVSNSTTIQGFFKELGYYIGGMALAMSPLLRGFFAFFLIMEDFGVYAKNGKSLLGVFVKTFSDLGKLDWGDTMFGAWLAFMESMREFGDWLANTKEGLLITKLFDKMEESGATASITSIGPTGLPVIEDLEREANTIGRTDTTDLFPGQTTVTNNNNSTFNVSKEEVGAAVKADADNKERKSGTKKLSRN